LSLLTLPKEIQEAIITGQIGTSQWYIFADNLSSPVLLQIFNAALNKPMTNAALKMAFVAAAQTDKVKTERKPQPVQRLRNNIKSVRNIIDLQVSKMAPKELTDLLADMEALTLQVRQELDRQANEAMRISAKKEAASQAKAAAAAEKKSAKEEAAAASSSPAPDAASAEASAVETVQKAETKAKTTAKTKKAAKKKVLL
jgi:colicin import membrane protein